MTSRVSIVVLCEDEAHERFVREALVRLGHSEGRVIPKRSPGGDAKAGVRAQLAAELRVLRTRRHRSPNHALVVVVDADNAAVSERKRWLEDELPAGRDIDDAVVYLVPRRNIETWLIALNGGSAHEQLDEHGAVTNFENTAAGRASRGRAEVRRAARAFAARVLIEARDANVPSIDDGAAEMRTRLPHHAGSD